jgi:hypothetical protein
MAGYFVFDEVKNLKIKQQFFKRSMKRILALFFGVFMVIHVFAQNEKSYDVILKLNGEEHVGTVTEIGDEAIKFVHKGESLSYTFKKADVMKITFASGRVEIINGTPEVKEGNATPGSGLEAHHNKIAVLPFVYLIDKRDAGDEMSYKVQTECYSFLNNHIGELTLQDPVTTNALMIKAGITFQNIRGFTMGEICNILGVEYIVTGTITQNRSSVSSSSGTSTKAKSSSKNTVDKIFSGYSSSYSTSTQNYETSITMNIYTDKDTNIFTKDHASFWSDNDAYKITLQYLLKRTPIYRK